jgi:hypothetical protein
LGLRGIGHRRRIGKRRCGQGNGGHDGTGLLDAHIEIVVVAGQAGRVGVHGGPGRRHQAVVVRKGAQHEELRSDPHFDAHAASEGEFFGAEPLGVDGGDHEARRRTCFDGKRQHTMLLHHAHGQRCDGSSGHVGGVFGQHRRHTMLLAQEPGQGVDIDEPELEQNGAQATATDLLHGEGMLDVRGAKRATSNK